MTRPTPLSCTLICHPATPTRQAMHLTVEVSGGPHGALILRYGLHAEVAGVRVPPPGNGGRADGLWQHTCFEAFLSAGAGDAYREFNFSPSGDWAVYDFSSYRVRDADPPAALCPAISVVREPASLVLEARLPRAALAVEHGDGRAGSAWRLGLTAVIEEADGHLSYWSLKHPMPAPDFHHGAGFALALDPRALWSQ